MNKCNATISAPKLNNSKRTQTLVQFEAHRILYVGLSRSKATLIEQAAKVYGCTVQTDVAYVSGSNERLVHYTVWAFSDTNAYLDHVAELVL